MPLPRPEIFIVHYGPDRSPPPEQRTIGLTKIKELRPADHEQTTVDTERPNLSTVLAHCNKVAYRLQ